MALSQKHIATVLHEAFTQYVAFLTASRQRHEESLPRLGKGVETTVDLTWEQSFRERLGAAELCLQQSERIARDVGKWANEPALDEVEQKNPVKNLSAFPAVEQLEEIWSLGPKFEDDEPFLDIFSGALIQPTTKYSAGPSGTQNQPLIETTSLKQSQNTQVRPVFPLTLILTQQKSKTYLQPRKTHLPNSAKLEEMESGQRLPPKQTIPRTGPTLIYHLLIWYSLINDFLSIHSKALALQAQVAGTVLVNIRHRVQNLKLLSLHLKAHSPQTFQKT
jgi:hypothetical protein